MMSQFCSAKLKIDRAKQHINVLKSEFDAFLDANPHTHSTKYEYDPNEYSGMRDVRISVEFGKDVTVPNILGLLIGDAVHNLRAALDHLMWELIGPVGTRQDKYLAFPMGDTWSNYESVINGLQATSPATKKFLKAFEAHGGGNGDLLYGLNILDRTDKHRILNPIIAAARITGVQDHKTGDEYGNLIGRIDANGEAVFPIWFRAIPYDGQPNFNVTLDVFFGNTDAFPRSPVVPTLAELADHVVAVREAFVNFVKGDP